MEGIKETLGGPDGLTEPSLSSVVALLAPQFASTAELRDVSIELLDAIVGLTLGQKKLISRIFKTPTSGVPHPQTGCLTLISDSDAIEAALRKQELVYGDQFITDDWDFQKWKERVSSLRTNIVLKVKKVLSESDSSRTEFYQCFATLMVRLRLRFVGSTPRRHSLQYLLDKEIQGDWRHRPDIVWAGALEAILTADNAARLLKGLIDEKKHPLVATAQDSASIRAKATKNQRTSTRKLYTYGEGIVNTRKGIAAHDWLQTIPCLSTDGVYVSAALIQPTEGRPVMYESDYARLTDSADDSDDAAVDLASRGFDLLLWFLFRSEVLTLRARAEKLLNEFREQGALAIFKSGLKDVEIVSQQSSTTFSVRVNLRILIAKLGLNLSQQQALGLGRFYQVQNEANLLPIVPKIPQLQNLVDCGHITNEAILLLFEPFGSALSNMKKMGKDEVDLLVQDIGVALITLHESGIVHSDIGMRNILQGPNGTFRLIDLGHAHRIADRPMHFLSADLLCCSEQALMGEVTNCLGDWESLAYIICQLTSESLPWTYSASKNDRILVKRQRDEIHRAPGSLIDGLGPVAHSVCATTFSILSGKQMFSNKIFAEILRGEESQFSSSPSSASAATFVAIR